MKINKVNVYSNRNYFELIGNEVSSNSIVLTKSVWPTRYKWHNPKFCHWIVQTVGIKAKEKSLCIKITKQQAQKFKI